jgi:phosphatidylglycerophosphatase A
LSENRFTKPNASAASWHFLLRDPGHFIALGAGTGLAPYTPGTAGTLLAWFIYVLVPWHGALLWLALVAGLFALGIPLCARTARALGATDPGAIVWDEMVAFWLVLAFTPATLMWQAFAFVLFRVFDIWKPPPIRYFERTLKGGFGIMFDDLLAAVYSLLAVALMRWATGG